MPKDRMKKMDSGTLSLELMTLASGSKQYILVFKTTLKVLYVGTLTFNSKIRRVEEKSAKF